MNGQIIPATSKEMEKEINAHAEWIQRMLADLNTFRETVLNEHLVK